MTEFDSQRYPLFYLFFFSFLFFLLGFICKLFVNGGSGKAVR